jgi:hypothetical protein
MRDTPKWQTTVILWSAVAVGAVVAVTFMNLIWALVKAPATCDTTRLTDGTLVNPQCAVEVPPGALTLLATIAGAAVGYSIYRWRSSARYISTDA